MAQGKAYKHKIGLEGAPSWYGTPLDKLPFEWSYDEKLEIERYCEIIHKNITEEGGMTPMERWKASFAGKPRDRQQIFLYTLNVYAARTLDSGADAIRPIEIYKNPKLYVKAHLASMARFKGDIMCFHSTSYAEDLWTTAKMIEYGQPCAVGDRPIKTLEDLEGLVVPDPKEAGLFPGYLWSMREVRRILDKYDLSDKIPFFSHTCCGPSFTAALGMLEWNDFVMGLRKKSELVQKCIDIGCEWNIKVGNALIELAHPEGINSCQFTGGYSLRGNDGEADSWKRFGDALADRTIMSFGYSSFHKVFEWFDVLYEKGALSEKCWNGGTGGHGQADYKKVLDWHKDHNLHIGWAPDEHVLLDGPVSAIDAQFKEYCEYAKTNPKFTMGVGAVPYWTPPHHVDAAIAAVKKYGRY